MSSVALGNQFLDPEITHISTHGIWLLSHEEEYFLSYEDFPWFRDIVVSKIINVQEISPGHYYWPDLDVDIGLDTIQHPERFPLKAK
ncbi:DUF2442 domain-containing protein [Myxococcota bacterium]|nr:DUF2442 domain-containing protein [Myxococcota bacterium]